MALCFWHATARLHIHTYAFVCVRVTVHFDVIAASTACGITSPLSLLPDLAVSSLFLLLCHTHTRMHVCMCMSVCALLDFLFIIMIIFCSPLTVINVSYAFFAPAAVFLIQNMYLDVCVCVYLLPPAAGGPLHICMYVYKCKFNCIYPIRIDDNEYLCCAHAARNLSGRARRGHWAKRNRRNNQPLVILHICIIYM